MAKASSGEELERIGDLGEQKFKNLCTLARLHCSKLAPDRTGKDFIVEFPSAKARGSAPFDMEPPPIQVVVQVKTILATTRSARLALSVADRLAKDTRPTIVAIFRINDDDQIESLHIVHLIDTKLGRILRSLRKASKDAEAKLHEMSISVAPEHGEKVPMDVLDFYAAISSLPGRGMLEYAARKTSQLRELGFSHDRFVAHFSVSASAEELVDGFLALKPLPVHNLVMSERRFDIEMVIQDIPQATMEFNPTPNFVGQVLVVCTKDGTRAELAIPAKILHVSKAYLGKGNVAIRAVSALGEFVIKDKKWSYRHPDDFGPKDRHSIEEWTDYLDLCCMLGSGQFSIEITGEGEGGRIRYKISDMTLSYDTEIEKTYLELLAKLRVIRDAARMGDMDVGLDELRLSVQPITVVAESVEKPYYHFQCEQEEGQLPLFVQERSAFIAAVNIMGRWIGYCAPATASAVAVKAKVVLTGTQTKKAIVEPLGNADVEKDFEAFRLKYSDLLDVQIALYQPPGQFLDGFSVLNDRRGSDSLRV